MKKTLKSNWKTAGKLVTLLSFCLALLVLPSNVFAENTDLNIDKLGLSTQAIGTSKAELSPEVQLKAKEAYGKLPIYFIPNKGQKDKRVKYYSQGAGYSFFLTDNSRSLIFSPKQKRAAHLTSRRVKTARTQASLTVMRKWTSLALTAKNKRSRVTL